MSQSFRSLAKALEWALGPHPLKVKTTRIVQAEVETVSASAWTMWISDKSDKLCRFPNLIEYFRRKCRFILRQETTVMLLNDVRCVLDGITGLLV